MPAYVKEQVHNIIIEELSVPINEMKDDAHLANDYGMDSLDLVEIALAIEEKFGIEITEEDARAWVLVKDLVNWVEEATKK